ncbi:MAG: hypothetical protein ACJ8EB_12460 [Allosphingosinicella sp.]
MARRNESPEGKSALTLILALFLVAGPGGAEARRSAGYAGSTPAGLDGSAAFASLDCAKINRHPRLGRFRVPLSSDCALAIPAPRGRLVARSRPLGDGGDHIVLGVTGGLTVKDLEQPVTFLWNPDGSGFVLNDGEGSGQTAQLRYFAYRRGGWRESRRMRSSAARLFLRRQHCRPGAYVNVSGMTWTVAGELRAIVQEGVHSQGCRQPESGNLALEVVGDPWSGRVRLERAIVSR